MFSVEIVRDRMSLYDKYLASQTRTLTCREKSETYSMTVSDAIGKKAGVVVADGQYGDGERGG